MEIRYTLTLDEFKEAYSLMLRNASFRHRFCYWQFTWLGPVLGIWILAMMLILLFSKDPNWPMLLILAIIGIVSLAAPLRYRRSLRRSFRLQKLDAELMLNLDSSGIDARRIGKDMDSHYGWTAMEGLRESKNLYVLFPSRLLFIPIPKRALPPDREPEIRALFESHFKHL